MSEFLERGVRRRLHGLGLSDIHGDRVNAPLGRERPSRGFSGGGIEIPQANCCTGVEQSPGDRVANAARRPGDHCHPAVEINLVHVIWKKVWLTIWRGTKLVNISELKIAEAAGTVPP